MKINSIGSWDMAVLVGFAGGIWTGKWWPLIIVFILYGLVDKIDESQDN